MSGGHLDNREVVLLYKRARVVVIPSICYEGFPRSVVEAYACGRPVVASRIGSLNELVEEGRTGLTFEPRNADDLSRVLNLTARNDQLIDSLGATARMTFSLKYGSSDNYHTLRRIYELAIQYRRTVQRDSHNLA